MTPAQLDVARRLVAAPWFPRPDGDLNWERVGGVLLPDLADDANGGVLLGMLARRASARGVRFEITVSVVPNESATKIHILWGVGDEESRFVEASTLAEAAALMLLEVRGG